MYNLCLCECIFGSKEIHFTIIKRSINNVFVSAKLQLGAVCVQADATNGLNFSKVIWYKPNT